MVWGQGDASGLRVTDTAIGRVGALICWENYMPLARYALYADGVEVYVASTWDDGDTWICRRDETIRLPYSEIIRYTREGIPYLAPELVLLFKAKHARPKDQADFDGTVPCMAPAQRETLSGLLARVHPGHPWLADL